MITVSLSVRCVNSRPGISVRTLSRLTEVHCGTRRHNARTRRHVVRLDVSESASRGRRAGERTRPAVGVGRCVASYGQPVSDYCLGRLSLSPTVGRRRRRPLRMINVVVATAVVDADRKLAVNTRRRW